VDHLLSDVQFARLNQDEIRFAHQARSDAVWSSMAAVFFASVAWRYGTSSGRAVAAVLGVLFTVFAVRSALFRETLVLNFRSRTWTRQRRLLGLSHVYRSGVFNDLEGLILSIESYSSRDVTLPAWIVRLAIHGDPNVPALAAFLDEERAYEWFTALVETLQLPVIDRTSVPERRCSWDAFERPLSSKPATIGTRSASEAPPRLPPDSAIRMIDHPRRMIVLPMQGIEANSLPGFLLGAAMISYAAIMWRNSVPREARFSLEDASSDGSLGGRCSTSDGSRKSRSSLGQCNGLAGMPSAVRVTADAERSWRYSFARRGACCTSGGR